MLCLSSCEAAPCKCQKVPYPPFPIAGEKVAKELETKGEMPHTFEWIARLYKLKQILSTNQ
ncbi:MAG: hypothetical protein IKL90_03250 [Alphaproteobacteria bacterium]|nr:hypothetical protein [Alphaproteobacteria bacterium]